MLGLTTVRLKTELKPGMNVEEEYLPLSNLSAGVFRFIVEKRGEVCMSKLHTIIHKAILTIIPKKVYCEGNWDKSIGRRTAQTPEDGYKFGRNQCIDEMLDNMTRLILRPFLFAEIIAAIKKRLAKLHIPAGTFQGPTEQKTAWTVWKAFHAATKTELNSLKE